MNKLLIALTVARFFDISTTYIALHGNNHEANPLLPNNPTLNLTLSSGATVGEIYILKEFHKTHPRIAKVITIGAIGTESIVAIHNAKR